MATSKLPIEFNSSQRKLFVHKTFAREQKNDLNGDWKGKLKWVLTERYYRSADLSKTNAIIRANAALVQVSDALTDISKYPLKCNTTS